MAQTVSCPKAPPKFGRALADKEGWFSAATT